MASRRDRSPRAQHMRALVAALATSGIGLPAFARKHGVAPSTLAYWRRRVQSLPDLRAETAFVPVRIAKDSPPPADSPTTIVVEVGDRYRVHIPLGFESSDVRRLLEALRPC